MPQARQAWELSPGRNRLSWEFELESSLPRVRSAKELDDLFEAAIVRRRAMQDVRIAGNSDRITDEGRLLVVNLDEVIEDGHAAEDSSLHLSTMNTPRPILWVGVRELTLVSWIPKEIADEIDIAVECNPEESFNWLE